MSATRDPAQRGVDPDDPDDSPADEIPPTPDEDGPHDVPDEKVIEKTLPTVPVPDSGSSAPP
jgi:hypothetical protein